MFTVNTYSDAKLCCNLKEFFRCSKADDEERDEDEEEGED